MSIVIGYPRTTTDAELDNMIQAENSRVWEEQQAEVPVMRTMKKEELADADASLHVADDCIAHGLEFLNETIDKIAGTVAADKLASIYDQISDLRFEAEKIRKEWGF